MALALAALASTLLNAGFMYRNPWLALAAGVVFACCIHRGV